ncbi:MAG: undecaprenyl/decaprenyl-phosphate alpha-N-acetylglucosaminyl 1-phosphate transferase [Anaerolineae bacterium]|nr:undecaprenyl/decaprenyl-phosphate alpha-N-acetylglucosaminyl 1-phosphate transferase [Anaerolineae bacterium]
MSQYILILASALALAAGGTPLARRAALRLGIVDQPNARKVHKTPIPLLGGAAIYTAFILALVLFGNHFYVNQVVGIFLGATLVSFMGLWDDRRELSPALRLVGQIVAAGMLIASGVQVHLFHWNALNWLITIIWVVGITNAFNFLDNMDGLSGGLSAIAAAFYLLFALMNGQYLVGALAAALLGACLGFLIYNFNPASIFMGDSGALFLGFVLAAVGIKLRFPNNTPVVTWMVPVLVMGLPIFDMTLVVFSRLRRGLNPITTPGRDHTSHRLVRMGASPRRAVLICYALAGALGMLALFVARASVAEGYAIGGITALAGIWGIWRMEQVDLA